jgi:hypothetical protein
MMKKMTFWELHTYGLAESIGVQALHRPWLSALPGLFSVLSYPKKERSEIRLKTRQKLS